MTQDSPSISFEGRKMPARELGEAFAERWDDAVSYVTNEGTTELRSSLAQSTLAVGANRIFDRYDKSLIGTEGAVFELIRLLTDGKELTFRGRTLTVEGLAEVGAEASDGDTEAAQWIRKLRSERILSNAIGDGQHADFARIESQLDRSWGLIQASVDRLNIARQRYREDAISGSSTSADLSATLSHSHSRMEGDLLQAAISKSGTEALRGGADRARDTRPRAAAWIASLRESTARDNPDPAEVLLLDALTPVAVADLTEAEQVVDAKRVRNEEVADAKRIHKELQQRKRQVKDQEADRRKRASIAIRAALQFAGAGAIFPGGIAVLVVAYFHSTQVIPRFESHWPHVRDAMVVHTVSVVLAAVVIGYLTLRVPAIKVNTVSRGYDFIAREKLRGYFIVGGSVGAVLTAGLGLFILPTLCVVVPYAFWALRNQDQ